MAAKVLFCLALIAAVAYAADSECKCDSPSDEENSALWDFLKKLSSDIPEGDDSNNERLDAVLPAELSPLLECNCLEKTETRRKRKILPEVTGESQESLYSEQSSDSLDDLRTPKCPHGYVWFGILCVDEKLVLDK